MTAPSGVRWIGQLDENRRRQFRRVLVWSAALHVAAILVAAFAPAPSTLSVPAAVTVDLVAVAPSARPAAPAPPKARPAPAPKPVEAPKPKPKAPVEKTVVLPKEARDPKPKPESRPEPRPVERSYADVMKDLKSKADDVDEEAAPPAPAQVASLGTSTSGSARGIRVDAATAAWMRNARVHVRKSWVLAPGFRAEDLATELRVQLDAQGNVIGEPEVVRRSGNPWYDDSVVRAIQKASPLPAPPEPGEWPFIFQPEEVL